MGASPSNPQAGTFSALVRPKLPFLTTLNFPDLSKLMNDPVRHNSSWPSIPTKLPSDIPKFEGKVGDDSGAHVTTFHFWCSSNSLNEDSVSLRLFQRNLTSNASKWYIEFPFAAFNSFDKSGKFNITKKESLGLTRALKVPTWGLEGLAPMFPYVKVGLPPADGCEVVGILWKVLHP